MEKEKNEQRPAWEILNEQKERILNQIKENPEILEKQILNPEIIYPDLKRYEVSTGTNNLMLSVVTVENKYADNTWILADTVSNAKYENDQGKEVPAFYLKKGEKATKIGVEVHEKNVQDSITGSWYKEKLEKPYIKNVNVYNLSQFSFAKDTYPKKMFYENNKKDSIILSEEKIEELNKNTFEAKLEKFFIEQKYNIKNKEELKPMNKEEFIHNIENSKTKDGNFHKDSYRMELFPSIAMAKSKKTIENSPIEEKKIEKEPNKKVQKTKKTGLKR